MTEVKLLNRGRWSMPAASPKLDSGHVKVMLSMGADEVRRIDARADAAHMTRSAYIVEMTLREEVGLVSAIETLRRELNRFAADNAGWKGEVAALRKHVERRDKAIENAQTLAHEALTEIEKRNKAGEPASSAAVVKVLKAIVQSLG